MTRIRTPSLGVGWASSVESWCLTFLEREALSLRVSPSHAPCFSTLDYYSKLLNDSGCAEDGGGLKGQHGLRPLFPRLSVGRFRILPTVSRSHIKIEQALAIGVKGVVVELDELL